MAARVHHHPHVPASVKRAAHGAERVAAATVFTLLPPIAFALCILSGLLLAMLVASVM